MMKTYVVIVDEPFIRREFKYQKSAVKFAMKMSDMYGNVTLIEYDENNHIVSRSAI
jgi:hypothetical protein